jgi:hypothetical protein
MKNPAISVVTIAVFAASLFFASGNVSAQARHRQPHHQVEQSRGATIALRPTNIKRGHVSEPDGYLAERLRPVERWRGTGGDRAVGRHFASGSAPPESRRQ